MAAARRSTVLLRVARRLPRTFGAQLKEVREAFDETQEEFAARCKIAVRSLSRWECGDALPDVAKVVLLAAKLGVELNELLGIPDLEL